MTLSYTGKKRIRKSFGKIPEAGRMPNLIEVQKSSYDQFLQKDERSYERIEEGLQAVFKSVFPIRDFSDRAVLEYVYSAPALIAKAQAKLNAILATSGTGAGGP